MCERIIIIDKGQILKQGTLEELLKEDNDDKIIEFSIDKTSRKPIPAQTDLKFQIQWDENQVNGVIALSRMESQLPEFLDFLNQNNLHLSHLECRRKTLDDLFTAMTGRRLNE